MNYSFDENMLNVNGKELKFDLKIESVLEKEGVLLVLILEHGSKLTNEHYHSRNIFGVNEEGEIIWQVEAPTKDPVDLYTGLFEEEGQVIGGAWSGGDCYLDPQTGKILKKILVR
jgi:hypothetical protein